MRRDGLSMRGLCGGFSIGLIERGYTRAQLARGWDNAKPETGRRPRAYHGAGGRKSNGAGCGYRARRDAAGLDPVPRQS